MKKAEKEAAKLKAAAAKSSGNNKGQPSPTLRFGIFSVSAEMQKTVELNLSTAGAQQIVNQRFGEALPVLITVKDLLHPLLPAANACLAGLQQSLLKQKGGGKTQWQRQGCEANVRTSRSCSDVAGEREVRA